MHHHPMLLRSWPVLPSPTSLGDRPSLWKQLSLLCFMGALLMAQTVKNLPAMQETWVPSLGWEDYLENGRATPLQYSCLENPTDKGVWRATVHGVTKSRTRLSNFHYSLLCFLGFLYGRETVIPKLLLLSGSHSSLGDAEGTEAPESQAGLRKAFTDLVPDFLLGVVAGAPPLQSWVWGTLKACTLHLLSLPAGWGLQVNTLPGCFCS